MLVGTIIVVCEMIIECHSHENDSLKTVDSSFGEHPRVLLKNQVYWLKLFIVLRAEKYSVALVKSNCVYLSIKT